MDKVKKIIMNQILIILWPMIIDSRVKLVYTTPPGLKVTGFLSLTLLAYALFSSVDFLSWSISDFLGGKLYQRKICFPKNQVMGHSYRPSYRESDYLGGHGLVNSTMIRNQKSWKNSMFFLIYFQFNGRMNDFPYHLNGF